MLQEATRVPGALSLVDCFEDEYFTYIVTKKPKQTLLEYLMKEGNGCLGEAEVVALFASIVDTVAGLHERGVAHRDICLDKIAIRISSGDNRASLKVHGFEEAAIIPHKATVI